MKTCFLPKTNTHRSVFASIAVWVVIGGMVPAGGCATFFTGRQQLGNEVTDSDEKLMKLVGDLTRPLGMNWQKIEAIALVTSLRGTGSDPRPSAQRSALENEMKTHDVQFPRRVLSSKNTSMVAVRGYLPPGVEKGDRIDLQVFIPRKSRSKSLVKGWLMRTRLREVRVLSGGIRSGHVVALGEGPVITDHVFKNGDKAKLMRRGVVMGGGVARAERKLGLAVRSKGGLDRTSALIGRRINARFHKYESGSKRGVAKPKRDNYIELSVPSRYKYNISRYMRVIASIAVRENPAERVNRIEQLRDDLLDPIRSAAAALQLEAIGQDGVPILKTGLSSSDPFVKFYSAEALAYLDDSEAAEPLAEAARDRAFRWHALTALSTLSHVSGYHALTSLLNDDSAETRYGAFRSLRTRDRRAPLVRGKLLNNEFRLHQIPGKGKPLVHISKSRRREIILFGGNQPFQAPPVLYAGPIMITSTKKGRLKVSHFSTIQPDQQETCRAHLGDLILTVAKVGGSYGDIVQLIQEAKEKGHLSSRVVVDAKPRADRKKSLAKASGTENKQSPIGTAPLLFQRPGDEPAPDDPESSNATWSDRGWEKQRQRGFFDRMTSWWTGE